MSHNLTDYQIKKLIQKVFALDSSDKVLNILVDVPTASVPDTAHWKDRRTVAFEWLRMLQNVKAETSLKQVELIYYENVGSNNADLPLQAFQWTGDPKIANSTAIQNEGTKLRLEDQLNKTNIVLALTQFSASAPLKLMAKKHRFRAASMPGFSREMIPALGIDYDTVHEQVMKLKRRLDDAVRIDMVFEAENQMHELCVDIRYRTAHASSGLVREPCTAWNLPSGEAFIVPYEGELGIKSQTAGSLPVQFGDEIVVYKIRDNRATEITSRGSFSEDEKRKLLAEPAYGNIAEIGFGVLRPLGIKPIGVPLLDEKLGLHIAFGRSDHFGGATSPGDFHSPRNVVHIDRIFIPEVQPEVKVGAVVLNYKSGRPETIIEDSEYTIL